MESEKSTLRIIQYLLWASIAFSLFSLAIVYLPVWLAATNPDFGYFMIFYFFGAPAILTLYAHSLLFYICLFAAYAYKKIINIDFFNFSILDFLYTGYTIFVVILIYKDFEMLARTFQSIIF